MFDAWLKTWEEAAIEQGYVRMSSFDRSQLARYLRGTQLMWIHERRHSEDLRIGTKMFLDLGKSARQNYVNAIAYRLTK